jgi:polysaccharide biosynthesis protein PslG
MIRWLMLVMALFLLPLAGVFLTQAQETVTPTPSPTLSHPTDYIIYMVGYNDTLGSIAAQFGVSMNAIMELNGMTNPDLVVIRQPIRIPVTSTRGAPLPATAAAASETPIIVMPADSTPSADNTLLPDTTPIIVSPLDTTPIPVGDETGTPLPVGDTTSTAPLDGTLIPTLAIPSPTPTVVPAFEYGVEAFFSDENVSDVTRQITALGMSWAKVRVSWREMQSEPTSIDYTRLDSIIDGLQLSGLGILLTVADAPEWARSSTTENGPPDNFGDYATFVGTLAARYAGRVKAYEIWNEPNLRREWNNPLHPISADSYAELLLGAYLSVKAADPAATVVSAGLAPTGFNDGINAVDDREFLERMYSLGLASMSDAIGAHPFGYANPPDSVCCDAPAGVLTHYGHPSFYFMDTLNDYRAIMLANGDAEHVLWVTDFGWGTSVDVGEEPPANSRFFTYTSLDAQAQYTARAFEIGRDTGFIGVMILYNLNGCGVQPANMEACYYSLTDLSRQQRPIYRTLSLMFAAAR